jgi:hypothetical protein
VGDLSFLRSGYPGLFQALIEEQKRTNELLERLLNEVQLWRGER